MHYSGCQVANILTWSPLKYEFFLEPLPLSDFLRSRFLLAFCLLFFASGCFWMFAFGCFCLPTVNRLLSGPSTSYFFNLFCLFSTDFFLFLP